MNELRIKDRTITLVDQVEEKLLDYFRTHKMKPGDPIPKEQDVSS